MNWIPGQGDTAPENPEIKSREFPGSVPERTPIQGGGFPAEGYRSIFMKGGVTHSGSAIVNPLPGVSG